MSALARRFCPADGLHCPVDVLHRSLPPPRRLLPLLLLPIATIGHSCPALPYCYCQRLPLPAAATSGAASHSLVFVA
ncbi:hypothetical protein GUJ93_ZPchr0006g41094 [Zizania palustris]|uniref:Uncharacterized protein n=1 Tax=Zizania palustris TaxID=103762 RepID=A0A8J5SVJ9_ZIZPA|nr:hypothetical protein GUJ93_ZPchr0006g41094 [Zizania palustris]